MGILNSRVVVLGTLFTVVAISFSLVELHRLSAAHTSADQSKFVTHDAPSTTAARKIALEVNPAASGAAATAAAGSVAGGTPLTGTRSSQFADQSGAP